MRRIGYIFILALALPLVALANAKREVRPPPEYLLYTAPAGLAAVNSALGGYAISPARGFRITAVGMRVTSASGGGAGNTVISIGDGTNTCTATLPCATSQTTGTYRVTGAGGGGTGCSFAANAKLLATVTTAGCTTTQPTFNTVHFVGEWL